MTIATVQFGSKALERDTTYVALLPDPEVVGPGPYPVLVQLHGYHDDHSSWLVKSRIWGHVQRYPLITILPTTSNGWWANLGNPNNWEDYVVKDLVAHVTATFPARPGKWAIGGLSMGGYGALRLGLKHPKLYCSVWAHSSAIFNPSVQDGMPFVWDDISRSDQWRNQARVDLSCYHWAAMIERASMPRLSFDCGTEDILIGHNRSFHAYLEQIGLPHHYAEHPGAHDWPYWDTHFQTALLQHAEVLGIKQAPEPVFMPPKVND